MCRFARDLAPWIVGMAIFLVAGAAGSADCRRRGDVAPAATASPAATAEGPLYPMADQLYTIDHDATLYYDFRANRDGSGKVKREARYDRNLWNTCAQFQIRLPVVTRFPIHGNPYTGFGNAELGYSYTTTSSAFDRALDIRVALPTESNGVEARQTQLKVFYTTKWKWSGGALSYMNEFAQSVTRSSTVRYASFYEGELVTPGYAFVDSSTLRGLRISAIYNGRVLFKSGGLYLSAVGGMLTGSLHDVALNLTDTWGVGSHGLWKYRVEATAVARF